MHRWSSWGRALDSRSGWTDGQTYLGDDAKDLQGQDGEERRLDEHDGRSKACNQEPEERDDGEEGEGEGEKEGGVGR